MKFYELDDPELNAKKNAMKSLIDHLDGMLMNDRQSRKSSKMPMQDEGNETMEEPQMPVIEEGEPSNEKMMTSLMSEEDEPQSLDRSLRDETQDYDQEIRHDVEDPGVSMSLDDSMQQMLEENAKYRPRMSESSKGHMYVVNKGGMKSHEVPQAAQANRSGRGSMIKKFKGR